MFTTKADTLKHNFFVAFIDLMKLKLIKTDAIEYVSILPLVTRDFYQHLRQLWKTTVYRTLVIWFNF